MILSKESMDKLKNDKYVTCEGTFLDKHVLEHWWNFCVRLMPNWVAPNLLTLMGPLVPVISVSILLLNTNRFDFNAPPWFSLLSAFSVFWF